MANWSAPLVSLLGVHPLETPDGKILRTLDDARKYVLKMPETDATHSAAGLLIMAAEEGGPYPMFARGAVYRAIYGYKSSKPRLTKQEAWREKRKAARARRP